MSSDTAFLTLMLDAPMQSWGFSSRFQRRTTGLHPTKSGIVGMICAAMGLAKGSDRERTVLEELSRLRMTTIVIPRQRRNHWTREVVDLPVLRLEDYHTVQGTRKASDPTGAKADPEATVLTHRQYLLDAKFGVLLKGDHALLHRVAENLGNPIWGIWLGRKNCIPAAPILVGCFDTDTAEEAWKVFLEILKLDYRPLKEFTRIEHVETFDAGNDTWSDGVPESFGNMRPWPIRRINQAVAEM